jgi:hypothetical protein
MMLTMMLMKMRMMIMINDIIYDNGHDDNALC